MGGLLSQLAVNGVIAGSMYALLGMSWSLIYGTTRIFHFAHAFVIVVAAYAAILVTMTLGLPLVLGFFAAIVVAILFGCGIELIIYRPFKRLGAGNFAIFIASMGILILGESVTRLILSSDSRSLHGFPTVTLNIGAVFFTTLNIFSVALSVITILGFGLYLRRTRSGKAIRAIASNSDMAETVGIRTGRISLLVFAIGSGAAALAAVLIALEGVATPDMGMGPLFAGVTVTFLGGIGSLSGALLGGLILGLSENLAMAFIPTTWKLVVGFTILLVVIIVKPRGLFGSEK